MRTLVRFGDEELTRMAVVSDLRRPLLPRTVATEAVRGMNGSRYAGAPLDEASLSLTLTVMGKDPVERAHEARRLARILNVQEPTRLEISLDDGLYYMAVPSSSQAATRYLNADSYEVEFALPDPVRYGERRTATVPSGGSVQVVVGGTYPALPLITAPAAKNGSGGVWRILLDESDYVQATAATARSVVVDCENRVLTVAGAVAMMAPLADWLVLTPGKHTLRMVGTGAATVTWVERWL